MSGGPTTAAGGGGGYQRTADLGVAETFACSLGVGIVRYTDPDPSANDPTVLHEIANNCNEALDLLRSRGIQEVPTRLEVNQLFFTEVNRRQIAWAAYVHDALALTTRTAWPFRRAILINPRPEWAGVTREVAANHASGYLSTDDSRHYLCHEYGHLLWRHDHPNRSSAADRATYQAAMRAVSRLVSGRARQSAAEFVAEIFVQYLVGKPPDPQVRRWYQQLGGRVL